MQQQITDKLAAVMEHFVQEARGPLNLCCWGCVASNSHAG